MTLENVRAIVRAAVEDAGWQVKRDLVAEKQYDSAVGPKRALIWINESVDQVGNVSVIGQFWSEGRNVLEPKGLVVNVNSPSDRVREQATRFIQSLEATIQDSYAVRLLRH